MITTLDLVTYFAGGHNLAFYLVCIEAGVHLQLNNKAFQKLGATLDAKCPTFIKSTPDFIGLESNCLKNSSERMTF